MNISSRIPNTKECMGRQYYEAKEFQTKCRKSTFLTAGEREAMELYRMQNDK